MIEITEQEKFKVALFYFKKHGSMYNYGKIFDDNHQLKAEVTLEDLENAIKTDKYNGTGCPCDRCLRMSSGWCTIIVKKHKKCVDYQYWRFPYRYWSKVMEHDIRVFGDEI